MRVDILSLVSIVAARSFASAAPAANAAAATATVRSGGQVLHFSGGSCQKKDGGLGVTVGVIPVQRPGPQQDYFGVLIPAGPGDMHGAIMTYRKDGDLDIVTNVSGKSSWTSGVFSGTSRKGRRTVIGSFSG